MKIELSCQNNQPGMPFHHFWESTGFSPAKLMLRSDMELQCDLIGGIAHHGIRYVRIHFLLDLVVVKRDRWGTLQGFDWSFLDQALHRLVRNGLRPIFELMGSPSGEYKRFDTREELEAWRDMIQALAAHLEDDAVFGKDEVRQWLFETWNEPDIPDGCFPGDADAFCRYYDACAAGLWAVDEQLQLGGPSTCRTLSPLLLRFLDHCDHEKSALDETKNVRIDFLSVHEKGARANSEDLTPNTMGIILRENWAMKYIAAHYGSKLGRLPFLNDECDPQAGWWDTHTWRGKAYYAALAARIIDQHQKAFVMRFNEHRVLENGILRYGLLSNDNGFLGRWGQRTLLARFVDGADEDASRTAYKDGKDHFALKMEEYPCEFIKQPIFNLMSMLAHLGNELVPFRVIADEPGNLGVLATRREQQVAVLVYSSKDDINWSGKEDVTLQWKGLSLSDVVLTHFAMDDVHEEGNPFWVWERLGAPEAATGALLPVHLEEMALCENLRLVQHVDGLRLDPAGYRFTAALPSVHLILLTPKMDQKPDSPKQIWSRCYPGLDGRINRMLRWTSTKDHLVFRYQVLGSEKMEGPYVPIHGDGTILVDTGFLHRNVTCSPYFYRIAVYGYGDQRPAAISSIHISGQ